MKLSIIIPTYNDEKYIKQCIESVLDIKIDEYEIIVVDDGSTDNTQNIVRQIKSNKIRLCTKNNGGLRSARMFGLEYVRGEYISFLDGDDWVDDGFFEKCSKKYD